MKVNYPLIQSLLDNDLYTFTVGQVAWDLYSNTKVEYAFINRGKTLFPPNFDKELKNQIEFLSHLQFTYEELTYLRLNTPLKNEYISWLSHYQLDPREVSIIQVGGELKITIKGLWCRTIFYEVVLLALISELYFTLTGIELAPDWEDRIIRKAENLSVNDCLWMEFGTRRRRSFLTQNTVVERMKSYRGFLGTSNVLLAMKFGVKPKGTMSHQGPMAISGMFGPTRANKIWRGNWIENFGNELSIFLPDTFTTDVFLRDFSRDEAEFWQGLRQDSGNPHVWADEKVIPFYNRIGVSLKNKSLVFSDNLTDEKYKILSLKYRDIATIIGGIGTFFTNDTFTDEQKLLGIKPLNMVIKLIRINGIDVVKLSDECGKETGNEKSIKNIKKELNICLQN